MPEGTELAAPRRWAPMDAIGSGGGGEARSPRGSHPLPADALGFVAGARGWLICIGNEGSN